MPIQYTNGSDTLTQQVDKLSLHTNGYNQSPLYAKGTSQINGSNLPNTQWAQVASSSGKGIDLKQISIPRPAPDEILVKIEFSGVCHTDLHAWKGDWPVTPKDSCVGGHEGAGYVAAIGSEVNDLHIGDVVGIQWINRTCGVCEYCEVGNQPLCPEIQTSGCAVDGTFQQYCICKADNAVRIPAGIPLEIAAPILCAGITVYKALLEADARQGGTMAIVGAGGGLGSLACQYAKAMGYKVLAISSGASKRHMCLTELGADYYVDYKSADLVEEVKGVTRGGPHAAVIVSSVEEPFHQALQYVRPGGTIVAVGLPPGKMSTDIFAMVTQKVTIKGSYVGNRYETEEALALLARAGLKLQSKVVNFHDLTKIYDMMEKGQMQGRAVLKIGDFPLTHPSTSDFLNTPATSVSDSLVSKNLKESIEQAGRDFRSDTVTVPTESVMQAIVNTSTFSDDVYDGGDASVNRLLERIIQLTGKEAALFVPSGTMGNQICLRTHLHQPPHTVLLDHRAHVQCWETGAIPILSQATVTMVEPKNGIHLTLDDVRDRIIEEHNIHFPPTRIVSLENSLSGSILPLKHAREISNYVRSVPVPQGRLPIAMHLDGARLWDAAASEGVSVKEYLSHFDTASLCLSKGLGAPMGSVIVGPREFINRAVWFRKMFGGATRQVGMMASAALKALENHLPLLPKVHTLARQMGDYLRSIGYELLLPVQTNMVILDLKRMKLSGDLVAEYCKLRGVRVFPNGRLVFHFQTSDDGVSRLRAALFQLINDHKSSRF